MSSRIEISDRLPSGNRFVFKHTPRGRQDLGIIRYGRWYDGDYPTVVLDGTDIDEWCEQIAKREARRV